jgi:hypothetical protein
VSGALATTHENPRERLFAPLVPVSTDHQGYVIIINPNRSDIAKKLEVDRPGKYALKVSNR